MFERTGPGGVLSLTLFSSDQRARRSIARPISHAAAKLDWPLLSDVEEDAAALAALVALPCSKGVRPLLRIGSPGSRGADNVD